jgi:hypothetical protein
VKKYYSPGMPLSKEKKLFDTIFDSSLVDSGIGDSTRIARGILKEVKNQASNLDFRILDIKKSNIIKDIHRKFGKSFFSDYKIDEYKAFASTQLLINGCSKTRSIEEGSARVVLEESLVNYMMRPKEKSENEFEKADAFTYSIALKKFDKKYAGNLDETQKGILSEYVVLSMKNDQREIGKFLNKKRGELAKSLTEGIKSPAVKADSDIRKGVIAIRESLLALEFNGSEDDVSELMLYAKLIEEISSDE